MSGPTPGEVVFLHGLEAETDGRGVPTGRKATYLRDAFGAATPALDTSVAQRVAAEQREGWGRWRFPYSAYEASFATPLERARAAIGPATRLVVGSSFGGAVALRLLHEAPRWTGAVLFLAGAGPKLTPYRSLPSGVRALLVHGRDDDVIPLADSETLAETSETAELVVVDDDHRLASIVNDEHLGRWVRRLLEPPAPPRAPSD